MSERARYLMVITAWIVAIVGFALLLANCSTDSGGGGGNVVPPAGSNWAFSYSPGLNGKDCSNFDFPTKDGAHMCTKKMAVALGKTITMVFTITGSNTLAVADPGDHPPATTRLYLQRRGDTLSCSTGYQQYRFWAGRVDLTPGQHTLQVPLVANDNWTDCYGAPASKNPAAFQALLNDINAVGYTFGGQSFAAHGVYAPNGGVHFKLDQYGIQ